MFKLYKLRLYGENHHLNSSVMLKDIIVSTILSDFSIGPKLYGIFPAGRLEELIEVIRLLIYCGKHLVIIELKCRLLPWIQATCLYPSTAARWLRSWHSFIRLKCRLLKSPIGSMRPHTTT